MSSGINRPYRITKPVLSSIESSTQDNKICVCQHLKHQPHQRRLQPQPLPLMPYRLLILATHHPRSRRKPRVVRSSVGDAAESRQALTQLQGCRLITSQPSPRSERGTSEPLPIFDTPIDPNSYPSPTCGYQLWGFYGFPRGAYSLYKNDRII